MLDFLIIETRVTKSGAIEICPDFDMSSRKDLMTRGKDFYAIWDEERGLWSTDESDAIRLIDRELDIYAEQNKERFTSGYRVMRLRRSSSGMIDRFHHFCKDQLRDNFHTLDQKLMFADSTAKRSDYVSKKLNYTLETGEPVAWNALMTTLYSEKELHKIEWSIGAIVNGGSRSLQKFMVLYGAQGTGKSTVIGIIQEMFKGYTAVFDAKALGSANKQFALEPFSSDPLIAIQHDGDLSRIEDNTRLNSLVSHETVLLEPKNKSAYPTRLQCFLIMGTNKPVKITDAKSGLIRRLIDVSPTGNTLPRSTYDRLRNAVSFELGKIAKRCKDIYEENPHHYDNYVPLNMLGASNDFFNFVQDSWFIFSKEDKTTLSNAWEMYKAYCDESKVPYPMSKMVFKEELKNYFLEYRERITLDNGTRVRSLYVGFKRDQFEAKPAEKDISKPESWIVFDGAESEFNKLCADCPAQLATDDGKPIMSWDKVTTTLKDISTECVHYVRLPENHIVIDFDIQDEQGNKSLERNLEAASKWPPTYTEVSKSGCGVHLHYIYTGDVHKLSRVYEEHIEVKIFTGKASLRRKLTKFNSLKVAEISSGLPFKEVKETLNKDICMSVKGLRTTILKCLKKEVHPNTRPNVDFIFKVLEDAYTSDLKYDVSDMFDAVVSFAAQSTNQSDYCLALVQKMHFKSKEDDIFDNRESDHKKPIAVFDLEVMMNLFVLGYMDIRSNATHALIDPDPAFCQKFIDTYDLIGFNNRKYDNHILYARAYLGFDDERLYKLSNSMIREKKGFIREAYGLSLTDLHDLASKKQSLKKWEIELGKKDKSLIKLHKELGLRWDEPVPEGKKQLVASYCMNDVIATKALYNALQPDLIAREILADVSGLTLNDTTNTHTTRLIFGKERSPQSQFNYRDLAIPVRPIDDDWKGYAFDENGEPTFKVYTKNSLPDGYSIMPFFPGYKKEKGKSTYRGEEVGEGGYVYSNPGMYRNVALLDIASMHPSTIRAENLFGPYTKNYTDLVDARVAIKHKDFESAGKIFDGKLKKWLTDEGTAKNLSTALKIAINSVYGLTAAKFDNPFRDPRNKDNIVAKRGALFMVNLKHAVQERGFTVAHIKTDSIKIPDATPEIIQFVMDYGKQYGYSFEHEATYERMCLVNDSTYIARYSEPHREDGKDIWWVATAKQFQVPYVYKTLFSKEPIEFYDQCETKEVDTALYLDMNEGLPDVTADEAERDEIIKLLNMDISTDEGQEEFRKAFYRFMKRHNYQTWKDIPEPIETIREWLGTTLNNLETLISHGHSYQFVGKVGLFCPVVDGAGGGKLLREEKDRAGYSSANGCTGYRWLEAATVEELKLNDKINRKYYDTLVTDAVAAISEWGDYEWFVSDNPCEKENDICGN